MPGESVLFGLWDLAAAEVQSAGMEVGWRYLLGGLWRRGDEQATDLAVGVRIPRDAPKLQVKGYEARKPRVLARQELVLASGARPPSFGRGNLEVTCGRGRLPA
jgi:hypothetical protein